MNYIYIKLYDKPSYEFLFELTSEQVTQLLKYEHLRCTPTMNKIVTSRNHNYLMTHYGSSRLPSWGYISGKFLRVVETIPQEPFNDRKVEIYIIST